MSEQLFTRAEIEHAVADAEKRGYDIGYASGVEDAAWNRGEVFNEGYKAGILDARVIGA